VVLDKLENIQRRHCFFPVPLKNGLLLCEVRNHNWYGVPRLTSMAKGQQISSRRHLGQVELNVEPNIAVVETRISLSCL
jgi:hypothetical protein